jgi:hypothetical protein
MGILGCDKLWFVVGVGITLLLSGLIMFYVKQKFSVYDRHITEQSQMLKHLVNSIQSNTLHSLSSRDAVYAAQKAHEQLSNDKNDEHSRIVVSDDEGNENDYTDDDDDDDDDDDEDDSDSDDSFSSHSDSDEVDSRVNSKNIIVSKLDDKLNIKQINLLNDGVNILNIEDLSDVSQVLNNNSDEFYSDLSNNVKVVSLKLNDDNNLVEETLSSSKMNDLENTDKNIYVELSKQQLQDLCKERDLSTKGSKKDLIDRLLE